MSYGCLKGLFSGTRDSGERFQSLTRLLNSREPYSMGTQKCSCFARWCLYFGEGGVGMSSRFVIDSLLFL